jgi:drug/metabolite transporter (DMT)-like permease
MVGAISPALTVLLAWVALRESLNGLQVLGVTVVTLSVVLLSRDHRASLRANLQKKPQEG